MPEHLAHFSLVSPEVPEDNAWKLDAYPAEGELPSIDPIVTGTRAEKYNFAMGNESPGKDQIAQVMQSGNERYLRQKLVSDQGIKAQRVKMLVAEDIVRGRGGELSKQEKDIISSLTAQEIEATIDNPDSILEKLYAEKIVDIANSSAVHTAFNRVFIEDPDKADEIAGRASRIVATKEVAQKLREDIAERWKHAGIGATISNYAEQIVPGFSWYNFQNAIKGSVPNSFLPGNNMEEQITHLFTLPPGQAATALVETMKIMEEANPLDAMNFLDAVVGMTNNDRFLNNVFGVLDLATPIGIVSPTKVIRSGVSATAHLGSVMKDVVKASGKQAVRSEEVLEATGAVRLAAHEYLTKTLANASERAAVQGQQATWDDFIGKLPLLHNPKAWVEGGALAKSTNFMSKVENELTSTSASMIDGVLVEPLAVHRIVPGTPAFEAAVDEAIYRVGVQSPYAVDNIMYASPGKPLLGGAMSDETLSGTNMLHLHFGHRGGQPFAREVEAQWRINQWGLKDAKVVPQGNGYAIQVRTTINEADPKVRSLLIETEAPTPRGLANLFLSWLRTPNDLVSADVIRDRTTATYGISQLTEMGRTILSDISKSMDKASYKDFSTFITKQRDYVDPTTKQRGRFSENLSVFEQDWLRTHGRLPTEGEALAYMRYVQVSNMDLAVRSLTNHKNKASLGIEHIKLPRGNSWDDFQGGIAVEGRIMKESPFDQAERFSFLIWNPKVGIAKEVGGEAPNLKAPGTWYPNSDNIPRKETLERIAKEGLVPVQLTREGEAALRMDPRFAKALPEGRIEYIFVKSPRTEPLPLTQVPDRPGGHVKMKDGFYLSQPQISARTSKGSTYHYYHGDINLAHFVREADAKALLPHFEEARKLLKEAGNKQGSDLSKVSAYLATHLPGLFPSVDDFTKLFKGADSHSLNHSFVVRPHGRTVNDVENLSPKYANFRMGGDDVHNVRLQRQDPAYLKERGDIFPTIAWSGSEHSPKLTFAPAELVDPLETMESAFQSVIRSKYLDDMRIKVTERFINEFAHVLDTPIELLKTNPWAHLLEPQFKRGADAQTVQAARNLRRTTLEFLNIKTPLEKEIEYVRNKMVESVYTVVGKDGLSKLEKGKEILDRWTMGATKDPIKFLRSLAFHEKLGLYNPKQLFLQAQNLTSILSIEGPVRGTKAASAYMFHRGMMINSTSEVVEGLAKAAGKMGWKKEELLESWEAANRSGFLRVGGEVAYLDESASPSLIQTSFGRLLDNAAFFFREGERISRITAWNASYLRWKEANPGKILTDLEIGKVLERADILNGNMSRASNAMWQNGITSIPTQFWSYQARLSELMLGKRLTPAEKARMVAGYSLMYGLPTGGALYAGGLWPWHEAVRKYQIENGGAYDEGVVSRIMTEGFGGVAAGVVFGERTNFSEQYSPQGLSVIKDLFDPNKGIFNLLRGVSGTVMVDNIKSTQPFAMAILKVVGMDGGYDLTARDFTDAFSQISSINNLGKAWHAYYSQEYWSKKEQKLTSGEINAAKAVLIGATGLIPQKISDAYLMAASMKDRKDAQKGVREEAIKNLRLGFKATGVDEADKYFRRATIHIQSGQFTPNEQRQILEQASKGYEEMVDSIALKYAQTKPERMQDLLRKGR